MGNRSVDELIKDLECSDESKKIYAIDDLSEFKNAKLGVALIYLLEKEKSQLVREAIVESLKKIIIPEMFDAIFKMFASDDAFTRNAATVIFAGCADKAVHFLAQAFLASNNEIKKLILDSLYEIKTPLAIKTIRLGLDDPNINVLISSIEYLGLLYDYESGNRFIEILKSSGQPMLTITLLASIAKISNEIIINQAINIVLPELNYKKLNLLYLGEILNLVGEGGGAEDILKILEVDFDYSVYSEEISSFLLKSGNRFQEITSYSKVREILLKILNNENINNKTLLNILNLLLNCKDTMICIGIEKLSVLAILEEKKFKHELVQLLNKEWYGINNR